MNQDEILSQRLSQILEESVRSNRGMIPTLQAVQQLMGSLSDSVIERVAQSMQRPFCEVVEVVDFYAFLHREPRGERHVVVCMATSCSGQGSQEVLDALRAELDIEPGEMSEAGQFSLEVKYCLGACGQGPNVRINNEMHTGVQPGQVSELLADLR